MTSPCRANSPSSSESAACRCAWSWTTSLCHPCRLPLVPGAGGLAFRSACVHAWRASAFLCCEGSKDWGVRGASSDAVSLFDLGDTVPRRDVYAPCLEECCPESCLLWLPCRVSPPLGSALRRLSEFLENAIQAICGSPAGLVPTTTAALRICGWPLGCGFAVVRCFAPACLGLNKCIASPHPGYKDLGDQWRGSGATVLPVVMCLRLGSLGPIPRG